MEKSEKLALLSWNSTYSYCSESLHHCASVCPDLADPEMPSLWKSTGRRRTMGFLLTQREWKSSEPFIAELYIWGPL